MLAVSRYRVPVVEAVAFLHRAGQALDALAAQPGWLRGTVGRATDDPALWVVVSEWVDVGSYRRALNAYRVKVEAVPLLAQALDEPTAFEVLGGPAPARTARAADAGAVGVGEAAAPVVATDLD